MYIAAETEYGDTLYWDGSSWQESPSDAESFGDFAGSYEMGKLEEDYLEEPYRRTYRGVYIVRIYEL